MLRIALPLFLLLFCTSLNAQSFTVSQGGIPAEHGIGVRSSGGGFSTITRKHSNSGASYGIQRVQWTATGSVSGSQTLPVPGTHFAQASASTTTGEFIAGSTIPTDSAFHDLLVIALNNSGVILWTAQPEMPGDQQAWCAAAVTGGGVVVAGVNNTGDGHDMLVARFDASGQELWTSVFPLPGDQEALDVQVDNTGFTVAGRTMGPNGEDAILLRGDLNGALQWTRTLGGASTDTYRDLVVLPGGDHLITGTTQSFGDTTHTGARMRNIWLVRTNSTGDTLWTRTFGDTLVHRSCTALAQDAGGDLYIAGTYGNTPDNELMILRVSSTGTLLWERKVDHGGAERILDLLPIPGNGGFVATGWTFTDNGYQTLLLRRNAQGN